MLRFSAVGTKHVAFKEEREWRLVSSPTLDTSTLIASKSEVIGGIPQRVLKLKLFDKADVNYQASLASILSSVIIGPCEQPDIVAAALDDMLVAAGVSAAKVVLSGIPLRHPR